MAEDDDELRSLREALDDADETLGKELVHFQPLPQGRGPRSGSSVDAAHDLAWVAYKLALLQRARMSRDTAFTRYMAAMDARRQEHLRAMEAAADERAKAADERARLSAKFEENADHRTHAADMRDRRAEDREVEAERRERATQRLTRWITFATVASAFGAGVSAWNGCHRATPSTAPAAPPCASAVVPSPIVVCLSPLACYSEPGPAAPAQEKR